MHVTMAATAGMDTSNASGAERVKKNIIIYISDAVVEAVALLTQQIVVSVVIS